MIRRLGLQVAAVALLSALPSMTFPAMAQTVTAQVPAEDPYLWLEEVEGERAMQWVRQQNERSLGVLQADPRYQQLHDQALAILEARDRIPAPGFNRDGSIDNFWQDGEHVRGLWRRTSLDSYRSADTRWETILDIDALARAEDANWVYKGVTCLQPDERLCLVSLSDGGKDAVVMREFDTQARAFVQDGIELPESKGSAAWIDADTLLIARDFGEGSLTTSGYPLQVRRLTRGQTMDQAQVVFTGQETDVQVSPLVLRDADGAVRAVMIRRGVSFYESEHHLVDADGRTRRLELPAKVSINALVAGQLVATTDQDWTAPSGQAFQTGDVIAWDLDRWLADPATPPPW